MGCSTSKLDDEEAVQLCKDRKKFIRQAVEHRTKFALGHKAYIQAMKRVSAALREYIDGDDPREFLLDSFTTPVKKTTSGFISISPNSLSVTPIKSNGANSSIKINYFKSGGSSSVSVEERPPQSGETFRVESYTPMHHYGMEGMFAMQSSPMNSSFFHYSPNNRPVYAPPSPQTSQWDFFWNPFSSLDYYGYPTRTSFGHTILDDENAGLQQVREEEGIPELEEETEQEEIDDRNNESETVNQNANLDKDEVIVEDCDDTDEVSDDDDDDDASEEGHGTERASQSHEQECIEVAKSQQNVTQISSKETTIADCESKEETPGFTVYVNRRPTSMAEVIKDLEDQFTTACRAADELSSILEASRAQYSSSTDLTAVKMLNPVSLFRSASSRTSSARFTTSASTSRDEGYESSSDVSDDCMFSRSHQSTLDRLYAWEKKLYSEVRAGARVRIAYDKKFAQLQKHDMRGEDATFVDKTRSAMRDLHTQIKVSIHSVEAVSKRIEILRDEELEPQLLELIHGLARMWKVMAECHQIQKRTLDEAKILLAGTPSKLSGTRKYTIMSPSEPHKLARSAANLEAELRHWRSCFESWIVSQRSYMHALTGWLLRCIRSEPDSKLPFSPRRSVGAPAVFSICIKWSRFLDTVSEVPVLDGLDFFAAGVGSLYTQQLREDSRRHSEGGSRRFSGGNMEVVEAGRFEDEVLTAEKMAEIAIRVLCAGMSVAVSSLTEFSVGSAEGYEDLMKQWESGKQPSQQSLNGMEK